MKKPAIQDIMEKFSGVVRRDGFTAEDVRDLMNQTVLAHDPICVATVHKWLHGTVPRGGRLLGVIDFVNTRSKRGNGGKKSNQ